MSKFPPSPRLRRAGKCQKLRSRGFTIIEIIVALAMVTILSGALVGILISGQRNAIITQTQTEIQIETRKALDTIQRSIQLAQAVAITQSTYTLDNDTLILKIPAEDINQNIIPATFDYKIYTQDLNDSKKLLEIVIASPLSIRQNDTNVLTGNLQSINFQYYDSQNKLLDVALDNTSMVEASVTLAKTAQNKTVSHNLSTKTQLRNK